VCVVPLLFFLGMYVFHPVLSEKRKFTSHSGLGHGTVVVPVRWQEGLRCVLLTVSARGRLRVLGVNPCAGVRCTWIPDGDCLGGTGGEEKAPVHGQEGRSLDDARFQTAPFCYILYVEQSGFRCSMSSGHREGGPRLNRSSIALGSTCAVQVSTTRRPSPRIEDGEGVAAPRSVTDSTEQWV
jgi:hypothetical protein